MPLLLKNTMPLLFYRVSSASPLPKKKKGPRTIASPFLKGIAAFYFYRVSTPLYFFRVEQGVPHVLWKRERVRDINVSLLLQGSNASLLLQGINSSPLLAKLPLHNVGSVPNLQILPLVCMYTHTHTHTHEYIHTY